MTTYLNLLPWRYRRGQLIGLRLRQWCAVWALASLVVASLGWTQWSQYRKGAARLASLRREYAPVKAMGDETETLRQRIQELRQRETLVLTLADERPMLTLVGLLSRAARDCDGNVSIQRLTLKRQTNNSTDEGADHVLSLVGVATDDGSVAHFAATLRDSGAFRHVELKSTGTRTVAMRNANVEARTYQLECLF